MDSKEIKNFVFDKGAFGYKTDEVTECLSDISDYVSSLESKIDKLEDELKSARLDAKKAEEEQRSVQDILLSAQQLKKNIINEAGRKSADILYKAKEQARTLIREAEGKTEKYIKQSISRTQDIERDARLAAKQSVEYLKKVQKEIYEFKSDLLNKYKSHLDLITKIPEVDKDLIEGGSFLDAPENNSSKMYENLKKEISFDNVYEELEQNTQEIGVESLKNSESLDSKDGKETKSEHSEKEDALEGGGDSPEPGAKHERENLNISKEDKDQPNGQSNDRDKGDKHDSKKTPQKKHSFKIKVKDKNNGAPKPDMDYKSKFGALHFGESNQSDD